MIFFRRHYRRRLLMAGTARPPTPVKVCHALGARAAGAVLRGTTAGLTAQRDGGCWSRESVQLRGATAMYVLALAMSAPRRPGLGVLPPAERGLPRRHRRSARRVGVAIGGLSIETFFLARSPPLARRHRPAAQLRRLPATSRCRPRSAGCSRAYSAEASPGLAAPRRRSLPRERPGAAGLARATSSACTAPAPSSPPSPRCCTWCWRWPRSAAPTCGCWPGC